MLVVEVGGIWYHDDDDGCGGCGVKGEEVDDDDDGTISIIG